MQCRQCSSENRELAVYCIHCGHRLALTCPGCGRSLPAHAEFCDECGTWVAASGEGGPAAAGAAGQTPWLSRLVGRAHEMSALEAAVGRAVGGEGQVAGLAGEDGVGKSRLCAEILHRYAARGVSVFATGGMPEAAETPFLPLLDFLRDYFGIVEADGDRVAREKVAGRLLLLDEAFREALPLVFEFLGVADPARPTPRLEPEVRQRHLFAFAKRVVQARSLHEPVIMLFEDIHLLDGMSEAFVHNQVESLQGTRTFMLLTFPPDYHAAWMRKPYYKHLLLQPLPREAVEELLEDMLGTDPSVRPLAERIAERSGGSPLLVEQLVRALAENGAIEGKPGAYRAARPAAEETLPRTLRAVIAARMDCLGERARELLQVASVVGDRVTPVMLQRVVDWPDADVAAALEQLRVSHLLRPESGPSPTPTFAFTHAAVRAAAYAAVTADRRRGAHDAAAAAIVALYPNRLDEQAGLIGYHAERAGDLAHAVEWNRRAAEWAGVSDIGAALHHWRKVRHLLAGMEDSRRNAQLGLAAQKGILDCGWRVGLSNLYGGIRGVAGEVDESLDSIAEAAEVADRMDDLALKLTFRVSLAYSHYLAGNLQQALAVVEDSIASPPDDPLLGAPSLGFSPYLWLVMFRGPILCQVGRTDDARHQLQQAMGLAREHDEDKICCWAHINFVRLAQYTGEPDGALDHARQGLEIAERFQALSSLVSGYDALGRAHALTQRWGEAITALEQALAFVRDSPSGLAAEAAVLALLATGYLHRDDRRLALRTAEEAVAVARQRRTRCHECYSQLALARVLLRTEGVRARDAIAGALGQALELARATGAVADEPFVHEERAALIRLGGDEAGARRELREAHRLFSEVGATGHAARVAGALNRSRTP